MCLSTIKIPWLFENTNNALTFGNKWSSLIFPWNFPDHYCFPDHKYWKLEIIAFLIFNIVQHFKHLSIDKTNYASTSGLASLTRPQGLTWWATAIIFYVNSTSNIMWLTLDQNWNRMMGQNLNGIKTQLNRKNYKYIYIYMIEIK